MNNASTPDSATSADFLRADKVSNSRALTLYAIGVVLGLTLGGIGLFNARGTTTNKVPDDVLALVNQQPILRSDFITQLENEMGVPFAESTQEDRLRVLDEMLREELFVQRGLELNFAETDQDTRSALYYIVEQQVTADVNFSKATDQELRDFYDKHQAAFMTEGKLDVHNLVLVDQDPAKAMQVVEALRAGTDINEVKMRFGLTEGTYYQAELYYLAKVHLGAALFEAAKQLDAGQYSDPVLAEDGFHIVQVVSNSKPVPQNYEQALAGSLRGAYGQSEKNRVLTNIMKFLRSRSTILIADDYKDTYRPEDFDGKY
jgi:parvulin-like peptidyl-prolyl isomerase